MRHIDAHHFNHVIAALSKFKRYNRRDVFTILMLLCRIRDLMDFDRIAQIRRVATLDIVMIFSARRKSKDSSA